MQVVFSKVKEFLRIESAAIERAANRLDRRSIELAIEILGNCEGKVVVMGIGKSGVIAQKIAQTMTSTGTVAIFVHPSDALHGSLGVIKNGDVVIALSNSGETDELLAIIPFVKKRGVPILAIVGDLTSSLAELSDVSLDASVDHEACPFDLAPTTSTTVALSLGDAISMVLMESKGLTADDFAANHPAGRLGKRLTLTVNDLMHASPNVSPKTGWLSVVKAISDATLGAVNVVDGHEKLIGIITDGDLRRTIERTNPTSFGELNAKEMMTPSPTTTNASMLAYDALRIMEDRQSQISVLPVVDESGRAIGLVRLHDIVKNGL